MSFNRSLFFTTVSLLFAVLLVPLYVNNSLFFPFITGKNFAFRIIVELAALGWVILMFRDKSYLPKFSWLTIALTVFVGVVAVADIFSSNPVKSFLSNFERMEGWITLAHLLVFFFALTSILKTWIFWKKFLQASVAVSSIVCVHGFMQLAGSAAIHQSTSRLDASFGNATYLAIYMLFHVFITAILLYRHLKERKEKIVWYQDWAVYVYSIVIILQSTVLFFTATRGSILGLIGGMIVSAILVAITEREHKALRKTSIYVLISLVALVGAFVLARNTSFVQNNEVLGRLASISATDNTTKARFLIWNMAWKGVTQDPKHFVIGWGQESFNYIFSKYYDPRMYAQEQWFDRSHNVVFDWLTASGVLGLFSYLSIFILTLCAVWRKSKISNLEKSLITGLLAGYFFHNIFVFDNITSYVMFMIVLAYVNFTASNNQSKSGEFGELNQYIGIGSAIIFFGFVFYQYNYIPISANLALMQSIRPIQTIGAGAKNQYVYIQGNIDSFKKAIAYNTVGLYETREQLLDITQKTLNGGSDDSVKKNMLTLAETEIQRQLAETPVDVRYYVLGGNFLQSIGDYKNSEILLAKAKELSPNKQSLLFVVGSNYFAADKITEALATFKTAYELDKTFDQARKFYGLVALYAGQDKITNELFGPGPIMDPQFLGAYKVTKHYDLMVAYLEKSVESKPTDLQSYIVLAAGYVTAGNRNKAVTILQKAKTLTEDKNTQTQIDTLIKDVQLGKNPFEATVK